MRGAVRKTAAALTLALAGMAGTVVQAEGFTIVDLGGVNSREQCLFKAELTIRRYGENTSVNKVAVGSWTVMGFDVGFSDTDAVIVCARNDNNRNRASLVVHSPVEASQREAQADQIESVWDGF
jgi:hypothetical protein